MSYLDFVLTLFFAFGVAFRIGGHHTAVLDRDHPPEPEGEAPLRHRRVFVVGMLLTPPDVFSQTLLAIPMWGLWEIGLFFARFWREERRRAGSGTTGRGAEAPFLFSCPFEAYGKAPSSRWFSNT